jgi:hypothetical protein
MKTLGLLAPVALAALTLCAVAWAEEAPAPSLRFTLTDTPGEFQFATGMINGILRPDGRPLGLLPATHTKTGTSLAKSMGIFNYYRLFTVNHRYGNSARELPCKATLESDGSVHAYWAAADDRPFVLEGHYRWTAEGTLDLKTTVTAKADLPGLEIFLSSYFTDGFPATHVYAKQADGPAFVTPEKEDGVWHAFPSDARGRALVKDGRWTYPPSPVDWVMLADYAAPLAFRRDPKTGVVVIMMAPPEDCFAVLTPCRGEDHRSVYFSLFGRDMKAGETVHAQSRFVVGQNLSDEEILAMYQAYVKAATEKKKP